MDRINKFEKKENEIILYGFVKTKTFARSVFFLFCFVPLVGYFFLLYGFFIENEPKLFFAIIVWTFINYRLIRLLLFNWKGAEVIYCSKNKLTHIRDFVWFKKTNTYENISYYPYYESRLAHDEKEKGNFETYGVVYFHYDEETRNFVCGTGVKFEVELIVDFIDLFYEKFGIDKKH